MQRDPGYDVAHITHLHKNEYPYLNEQEHIYVDYTGSGLPSMTQIKAHHARMASTVAGNPHSINPASDASMALVDVARHRFLDFLHAAPEKYAVIFTANTTAAARLIGEAYPFD